MYRNKIKHWPSSYYFLRSFITMNPVYLFIPVSYFPSTSHSNNLSLSTIAYSEHNYRAIRFDEQQQIASNAITNNKLIINIEPTNTST